ncbi:MAG: hypothetical protein K9N49_06845 [Candidatus Marinimicrobia bacterium]|nr:hypothetical protein [Candidatus Neomarinimicrobiota bacterium]
MRNKPYYSVRTGMHLPQGPSLDLVKNLFLALYNRLQHQGYFHEYFGYSCVDEGDVEGKLGPDIENAFFLSLKKDGLWPIATKLPDYVEGDLFDVMEFLFDCVSKPVEKYYHSFSNCGWHYTMFDQSLGQAEFQAEINKLLRDYQDGFEMSQEGEILSAVAPGFENLLDAELPTDDLRNVKCKVNHAVLKFRRYSATVNDRHDAIRELADVLEFLRGQVKNVLNSSDESDLFNIINRFGIRHHNQQQKTDYDQAIWIRWMFYYFLATIHAVLRLIAKNEAGQNSAMEDIGAGDVES